jgi:hypothetical protein
MMMNLTTPPPQATLQPKTSMTVHACNSMQCMQREIVETCLAPLGARVTTEIHFVDMTLYKIAGASFGDISACASELWRATRADQVNIKPEIYHTHIEIIHGR